MRKFSFEKLVRDKIVPGIIKSGNKPYYKVLGKRKYLEQLKRKVIEEAEELPLDNKKELIKELADIQEVIDNFIYTLGTTKKELRRVQKKKNKKAGSFKKRHYISHVEANEDSEWVDYYLKSPEKYPEIK